ncbi:MAG: metallophosphoesterase [Clostridia bacterium]|nr:metallophosphoesterase [Clostridia bacterium]
MKRNFTRLISMVLSLVMLLGVVSLIACGDNGASDATTEKPGTTEAPGTTENPGTTGGDPGQEEPTYTQPDWLTNFDEKLAAVGNFYGRPMSVAWGGDTVNYPIGSLEAMSAAIELGADAIGVYLAKTSDGVIIAMPKDNLTDSTNFYEAREKNEGLPAIGRASDWTYEQICKLNLKNADGTTSDKLIPKFEDVVALCKGKCFIYFTNDPTAKTYPAMIDGPVYEAVKKHNAYSTMMVTPGIAKLASWSKADAANTELASFITNTVEKTYYKIDNYFEARQPFDPTVKHDDIASSGYDESWTAVSDNEEGWAKAISARYTFLVTGNIAELTKYIATNNKSALEYQPTKWDVTEYSIEKEDLTGRYLLISDIHYAAAEIPNSFVNRDKYRGWTNKERLEMMCNDIRDEYNQRGLDAIFVLGDLSTDDPPHNTHLGRFADKLWTEYLVPLSKELNIPIMPVGGNHDGYSNNIWKKWFGVERQYSWVNPRNGDVFIMCDTFDPARGTNSGGSGISWTDIDAEWLTAELEKHKSAPNIFLGSHWFGRGEAGLGTMAETIAAYGNVRCLFDAHNHHYAGLEKGMDGMSAGIINTGSFSYSDTVYTTMNGPAGYKAYYNFDFHDMDDVWGFQIVETAKDGKVVSYRVDTEHWYVGTAVPENPSTYKGQWGFVDYVCYLKYPEIVLRKAAQ